MPSLTLPDQTGPSQAIPGTVQRLVSQDSLITSLIILLSLVAWSWNIHIVFFDGEGSLTSSYVNLTASKFPIVTFPIFFGLGCWGEFRKWLRSHPFGLAYLCIVLGHALWPLPK